MFEFHEFVETIQKMQVLIGEGKLIEAEYVGNGLLKQMPHQPDVMHLMGIIALNSGKYDQAISIYNEVLKSRPGQALYHFNLGLAHYRAGQFDLAVSNLQKVVELDSDFPLVYSDLCLAYMQAGNIEAALAAGKKAVELAPDHVASHYNLALAYDAWRDFNASVAHYARAADLSPGNPDIQSRLGTAYIGLGNIDAARCCFQKQLEISPAQVDAYSNLVRITKYNSPGHEDEVTLRSLLERDEISEAERVHAYFALGKIHQDCGLYDEAFDYFSKGNKICDGMYKYDLQEQIDRVSLLMKFYTRELLAEKSLLGNSSETPVFVVGTPRSGSTLVEQIISSHPKVFGAGELAWIARAIDALQGYLATSVQYPACIHELTSGSIKELGMKYLRYIHSLAAGQHRIVDKMLDNYLNIGFIHILFPSAKIIHCRREPLDSCVSMFSYVFQKGATYSYDLFKLGAHYAQYERMMEHWRSVLPSGMMIEVDYESIVRHQEEQSRGLIEFLGLEWDEACLAFYKQKRRVVTASDIQVRQPIYTGSIGRWKNYRKHLKPLQEGLSYDYSN